MRTRHTKEAVLNLEQQKKQARELLRAVRAGSTEALARVRGQHLRWAGVEDRTARQEIALHDAQFVIARERGFPVGRNSKPTRSRRARHATRGCLWPICNGSRIAFTA